MSSTRNKVVLAAIIGSLGLGTLCQQAITAEKGIAAVSHADLQSWVEKRLKEWQPTAADRRFDEVGWAKDIRDAERLAKEHQRPVFLFTHDGRMAIGRC